MIYATFNILILKTRFYPKTFPVIYFFQTEYEKNQKTKNTRKRQKQTNKQTKTIKETRAVNILKKIGGFLWSSIIKDFSRAEMSIFLIELIYLVDFGFMIHRFPTRT